MSVDIEDNHKLNKPKKSDSDLPKYDTSMRELVDSSKEDVLNIKHPVHVRVSARQGESTEQMLRRFNFAVQDVVQKIKDIQFYEKPSKRKQKEEKLRIQQIRRYERQ